MGETISASLLPIFSGYSCLGRISFVLLGPGFGCSTLSGLALLANLRCSDGFLLTSSMTRFLLLNSMSLFSFINSSLICIGTVTDA